jgi:hypothetical protein
VQRRHGRRLEPPFRATPTLSELAPSTASPPSSSLPKESVETALNRRHHRRFSPENCELPPPNTPPSVPLRPNRAHRRPPGELLDRLDLFPLGLSRRSAVPGHPSPAPGSRSAWAVAQPPWPGWPVLWPQGPLASLCGSF